jgi:hypothetical protein
MKVARNQHESGGYDYSGGSFRRRLGTIAASRRIRASS